MLTLINRQFDAIRGVPLKAVQVGELAAFLENTSHSVVIAHKFVGPGYSTTCYDETEACIYRAHHANGIVAVWKHISKGNPRLRLLGKFEAYTPKEAK